MIIHRATNMAAVDYIKPYLDVYSDSLSLDEQAEWVYWNITENYQNTLVLLAFNDIQLAAFIMVRDIPGMIYSLIDQAWADPNLMDDKWTARMFLQTVIWSHDQGNTCIRAETERDVKTFERRWNFKEIAIVMQYDIPPDYEARVFDHIRVVQKDNDNGILRRRDNVGSETERSPTVDSSDNEEVPAGRGGGDGPGSEESVPGHANRKWGDALRGSTDRRASTGSSPSSGAAPK